MYYKIQNTDIQKVVGEYETFTLGKNCAYIISATPLPPPFIQVELEDIPVDDDLSDEKEDAIQHYGKKIEDLITKMPILFNLTPSFIKMTPNDQLNMLEFFSSQREHIQVKLETNGLISILNLEKKEAQRLFEAFNVRKEQILATFRDASTIIHNAKHLYHINFSLKQLDAFLNTDESNLYTLNLKDSNDIS